MADIRPGATGSLPSLLTPFNGKLFFVANDGTNGVELWSSDGSAGGTAMLKDIYSGSSSGSPGNLRVVSIGGNSRLVFSANNGVNVNEVFTSDGTASGTVLLADIVPSGSSSNAPGEFTSFNSKMYFAGTNGADGRELFTSDGTQGGTYMSVDLYPGTCSIGMGMFMPCDGNPSSLTVYNNKLYLRAGSPSNGVELWQCA